MAGLPPRLEGGRIPPKAGLPTRQNCLALAGLYCFMQYCVYIIFSEKLNKFYVGFTIDIDNRTIYPLWY